MNQIRTAFDFFGFTQTTIGKWAFATFVLLALVLAIIAIITKISEILNKPVAWAKQRTVDHNTIVELQKKVQELQQQQDEDRKNSIKHDKQIQKREDDIYNMLIQMQIKSDRWQVIDFAGRLSSGAVGSREQFSHIFDTYTQYEETLENLGRKNGRTTASMEVIKKKYQEYLQNGFPGEKQGE